MKARLALAATLALVVVPAAVAVSPPGGDTTPPTMTAASENVTENVNGAASAVVEYAEPVASDAVDGPVPVTCLPASGALFKLGTTRVTCTGRSGFPTAETASSWHAAREGRSAMTTKVSTRNRRIGVFLPLCCDD